MSKATVGEYKGHPTITLSWNDKAGVERKMGFGIVKARVILEQMDSIRVFVEHETAKEKE